jgi:hypothetical protein
MRTEPLKRVLAIDPFSRGVGFAVLEGPDSLIDWGLKCTGRADNGKAAHAVERLIDRFRPDILALEDWDAAGSRRCERVEKLLIRIAAVEAKRVCVQLISRRQICAIGPMPRTGTKRGRTCFLAERFLELHPLLPPVRKPWMPEDDRMAVFDATSFAVAYFALRRNRNLSSGTPPVE